MNIGVMQFANLTLGKTTNTMSTKQAVKSTSDSISKVSNFGDVFNKVISSSTKTSNTESTASNESVDLEKLAEVLNAESIEEVFDLLGISHDEGLLMIESGEGQLVAIDELMNLEDLLSVLNMDQNQLLETVHQLLEDSEVEINNVWDLIKVVTAQSSTFISQITAALQGEHNVTPKEAEQVLQFLKVVQSTGKVSDLLNDQEVKLSQLKELLQVISKEVEVSKQTITDNSSTKVSLQGFQQVVEQTVKKTETNEASPTLGSTSNITTTTTTKTVTITLPAEKSAQSDALTKEIQNLLNRSQLSNTQGSMKLLVKLYPENLGSIRIELMQHEGVLTARLLASTSLGKEMLDGQLQQLKTAFAQQNIQMDKIEVMQTLQETDRNMRDQNLFSNFNQQQTEQDDEDEQDQSENEEKMSFSEYLINEGV